MSASRSVSRTAYALGGKANGGGENGGKSRNGTGGEEPSRTEGQYIPHEDAFEEADRRALGKLSDDGARRGILSYIRVFSDVRDRVQPLQPRDLQCQRYSGHIRVPHRYRAGARGARRRAGAFQDGHQLRSSADGEFYRQKDQRRRDL